MSSLSPLGSDVKKPFALDPQPQQASAAQQLLQKAIERLTLNPPATGFGDAQTLLPGKISALKASADSAEPPVAASTAEDVEGAKPALQPIQLDLNECRCKDCIFSESEQKIRVGQQKLTSEDWGCYIYQNDWSDQLRDSLSKNLIKLNINRKCIGLNPIKLQIDRTFSRLSQISCVENSSAFDFQWQPVSEAQQLLQETVKESIQSVFPSSDYTPAKSDFSMERSLSSSTDVLTGKVSVFQPDEGDASFVLDDGKEVRLIFSLRRKGLIENPPQPPLYDCGNKKCRIPTTPIQTQPQKRTPMTEAEWDFHTDRKNEGDPLRDTKAEKIEELRERKRYLNGEMPARMKNPKIIQRNFDFKEDPISKTQASHPKQSSQAPEAKQSLQETVEQSIQDALLFPYYTAPSRFRLDRSPQD